MNTLTHLDQQGAAAMVDISSKADSQRLARAGALVQTRPEVILLIEQALLKKAMCWPPPASPALWRPKKPVT